MRSLLLPAGFASLLAISLAVRAPASAPPPSASPEPGTFPDDWVDGVGCATEPVIQVHPYNDDFYIMRQSKCLHIEAPFMYLIFGDERALLLDTGAGRGSRRVRQRRA